MTEMIGLVLQDLKKALINATNMLKCLKENKNKSKIKNQMEFLEMNLKI